MEASHVEKKKTTRQKSPAGQINSYHKSAVYDVEIFIFFPLVKASKGHFSFVYCSLTGPLKESPEKLKVTSQSPTQSPEYMLTMYVSANDGCVETARVFMLCCNAVIMVWNKSSSPRYSLRVGWVCFCAEGFFMLQLYIGLGTKKHLVRFRKTSQFGLADLFRCQDHGSRWSDFLVNNISPQISACLLEIAKQLEISTGLLKKHQDLLLQKWLDMSPDALKRICWCDSSCGRPFGSLVAQEAQLVPVYQ